MDVNCNDKVKIGHHFPLEGITLERKGQDELNRSVIVICLLTGFTVIGLGGAISSLLSGDYTVFLAVWATVHTFVGILIGYYFGRQGRGGQNDKDHDESAT